MGLDEIFPALTGMDIFLLDVEGFANRQELFRPKHTAVIRNELFGAAKLLNGRIEHNQDTGEILALKDITGENGPRERIHHCNHIKRASDLRNAMLLDVTNIYTPSLMANQGFERMGLGFVWLIWFRLDPVEPT